ncbi:translation initiation factor IF-2-like [Cricetulus griseus]|uniref:translation initiation factor IF-2-like n=1 Tax=Cricetulus griseus TaxID=10029 RepID=UPI0004547697|nr:translation initiation factor IF-2-like [Cricetulus griseus]
MDAGGRGSGVGNHSGGLREPGGGPRAGPRPRPRKTTTPRSLWAAGWEEAAGKGWSPGRSRRPIPPSREGGRDHLGGCGRTRVLIGRHEKGRPPWDWSDPSGGRRRRPGAAARISRAGSAGAAGKLSGRLPARLARPPVRPARRGRERGFAMQSTDLGNKERGKIWHRKPSPATQDGCAARRADGSPEGDARRSLPKPEDARPRRRCSPSPAGLRRSEPGCTVPFAPCTVHRAPRSARVAPGAVTW